MISTKGIFLSLALSGIVLAQDNKRLCAWTDMRAGVVRDGLYLDGGTLYENTWEDNKWPTQGVQPYPVNATRGIYRFNYSQPFKTSTSYKDIFSLISLNGVQSSPLYDNGAMFVDDYELYTYGGLASHAEHNNYTLNFRLYESPGETISDYGPYPLVQITGVPKHITHGADASIPSQELAFYFSGLTTPDDAELGELDAMSADGNVVQPTELSNLLIKVDLSTKGSAKWSSSQIPSEIPLRAGAKMVWLPVGAKGVLAVIGGVIYPQDIDEFFDSSNVTLTSANAAQGPGFMTSIPIYDIAGDKWYIQNTTGTSPPPSYAFCAVTASQSDASSHEIFMYGGYSGSSDFSSISDDVWVLSVPSFKWTQVFSGTDTHARSGHVCSTPFSSKMLVVGGEYLLSDNGFCVDDGTLFDIFDMNTLEFTGEWNPSKNETYVRSAKITDSTVLPTNIDSGLSSVLTAAYTGPAPVVWPFTAKKTHKSQPWLVPVVVVVVVVPVLIAAGVTWWCCRRRRKSKRPVSQPMSESSYGVPAWLGSVPKHLSETTTEIGNNDLPYIEGAAEAQGDNEFRRSIAEASADAQVSRSRASSPLVPGSPQSRSSGTAAELGSNAEIHEMDAGYGGNAGHSLLAVLQRGQRNKNPSIDETMSRSDSLNSSQFNTLGSGSYALSSPNRFSSSPLGLQPQKEEDESSISRPGSERKDTDDGTPYRPSHQRNLSDTSAISSRAISPPALEDDDDESDRIMNMTSHPVSPEMDHRPGHQRNTSSLSTNIPQLSPTAEEEMERPNTAGSRPQSSGNITRKPVSNSQPQQQTQEHEKETEREKDMEQEESQQEAKEQKTKKEDLHNFDFGFPSKKDDETHKEQHLASSTEAEKVDEKQDEEEETLTTAEKKDDNKNQHEHE